MLNITIQILIIIRQKADFSYIFSVVASIHNNLIQNPLFLFLFNSFLQGSNSTSVFQGMFFYTYECKCPFAFHVNISDTCYAGKTLECLEQTPHLFVSDCGIYSNELMDSHCWILISQVSLTLYRMVFIDSGNCCDALFFNINKSCSLQYLIDGINYTRIGCLYSPQALGINRLVPLSSLVHLVLVADSSSQTN